MGFDLKGALAGAAFSVAAVVIVAGIIALIVFLARTFGPNGMAVVVAGLVIMIGFIGGGFQKHMSED